MFYVKLAIQHVTLGISAQTYLVLVNILLELAIGLKEKKEHIQ